MAIVKFAWITAPKCLMNPITGNCMLNVLLVLEDRL